jgi:hypothetical protein
MPASWRVFWIRWHSALWAWNGPLAVAGEIAQLPDGRRGHEAAPQQPTLQQLSKPGGIADVGLAARQDLDVAGVDQQQLQPALLQHIPTGLPVLPRRLHHHLGDALPLQPVGQGLQARGERRVGADLLAASSPTPTRAGRVRDADAGHHLVLADIQPRGAFHDQLHRLPPPTGSPVLVVPGRANRGNDAETRARSKQFVVPGRPPRQSYQRALSHQGEPSLAGHTDSHPSWRPPAMGVLSEIDSRAPCYPAFPQVVRLRRCRRDGVNCGPAALPWPLSKTCPIVG